jgi:hypothetical protein
MRSAMATAAGVIWCAADWRLSGTRLVTIDGHL